MTGNVNIYIEIAAVDPNRMYYLRLLLNFQLNSNFIDRPVSNFLVNTSTNSEK